MSELIFCGVDIGTSNVKVILIDETAKTVWSKSIPVPRVADDVGMSTNASELVSVIEQLIVDGWHASGITAPIRAISITGVGEDGVAVDENLRPLDLVIPWFDNRAEEEAQQIREQFPDEIRGGVTIDSSRTVAKWLWLRRHRSEVLSQAATWIPITDYPAALWSNTPFMSDTLAARTGCFDVFKRDWIGSMLDFAGAPPLPPVRRAGSVIGSVVQGRLLIEGVATTDTLIVAGGHDHPIAASAVRRLDSDVVVDSLGTANLIYAEVPTVEAARSPYLAYSVPVMNTSGNSCLGVLEFSAFVEPFKKLSNGTTLREYLSQDRIPGPVSPVESIGRSLEELLSPKNRPVPQNDEATVRRALEATCFYAKRVLDAIEEKGADTTHIYSVSGWSRSTAFLQLRASIFGKPIFSVEEDELTALGVALLARDADPHVQGMPRFVRKTRCVEPYADWKEIYSGYWPSLQKLLPLS